MSNKLKTHYKTDDTGYSVCNKKAKSKQLTFDVEKVTCEHCRGTGVWQDDMSVKESKRKASSGELGEDKIPYVMKKDIDLKNFFKIVNRICVTEDKYSINDYNLIKNAKCIYINADYRKLECDGVNTTYSFFGLQHEILNKKEKTWIESAVDENKDEIGNLFAKTRKEVIENLFYGDTLHINTNVTSRIFDENGTMIWVKSPEYKPEDVAFKKKLPSKYHREYYSMSEGKSVVLDVYDKLAVMDLPNAEIEHTYKKLDRCGKGDKSLLEDLREARDQLDMGIKRIEKDLEV